MDGGGRVEEVTPKVWYAHIVQMFQNINSLKLSLKLECINQYLITIDCHLMMSFLQYYVTSIGTLFVDIDDGVTLFGVTFI